MVLLLASCGHKMCRQCVRQRLRTKNTFPCPLCKRARRGEVLLRRNDFTTVDRTLEKELRVRKQVLRVFVRQREDFESDRAHNDYLEEIEDLIAKRVSGIDHQQTTERIRQEEEQFQSQIIQTRQREEQIYKQMMAAIRQEEQERVERRRLYFEQERERKEELQRERERELQALTAPARARAEKKLEAKQKRLRRQLAEEQRRREKREAEEAKRKAEEEEEAKRKAERTVVIDLKKLREEEAERERRAREREEQSDGSDTEEPKIAELDLGPAESAAPETVSAAATAPAAAYRMGPQPIPNASLPPKNEEDALRASGFDPALLERRALLDALAELVL
eukprot:CAMPEP_0177651828 /NCGR_PEP_ID=MMETSP0447-20121125/12770_1 /TAXON_ID=0 /ORGANISM="Stygamoeba regulata, Strain BSH-02190019" /LENGTH=336 /DNA_ID=CAMNT_0019154963 /DNA_START=71 /DNA_END=1081 /DNA_ORIENTATION=+